MDANGIQPTTTDTSDQESRVFVNRTTHAQSIYEHIWNQSFFAGLYPAWFRTLHLALICIYKDYYAMSWSVTKRRLTFVFHKTLSKYHKLTLVLIFPFVWISVLSIFRNTFLFLIAAITWYFTNNFVILWSFWLHLHNILLLRYQPFYTTNLKSSPYMKQKEN